MVPHNFDVIMPLLIMQQPDRCNQKKTSMEFLCDAGITLLYHQLFQILLSPHIPGDICSVPNPLPMWCTGSSCIWLFMNDHFASWKVNGVLLILNVTSSTV